MIGIIDQNSFMINRFIRKDKIAYTKKESLMLYDVNVICSPKSLSPFLDEIITDS